MNDYFHSEQVRSEIKRIQEDKKIYKKGFLIFGLLNFFVFMLAIWDDGIEFFSESEAYGTVIFFVLLPLAYVVYFNSKFRKGIQINKLKKIIAEMEPKEKAQIKIDNEKNSFIALYEKKIEEKLKALNTSYPSSSIRIGMKNGLKLSLWKDEYSIFFIITNNTYLNKGFLKKLEGLSDESYKNHIEGIYRSLNYIKYDELMYYAIEGEKSSQMITSGGGGEAGGISLMGAAVGGLLFGPAGMIIGSRKKTTINEVHTEITEEDNRFINLYYKKGQKVEKIEFDYKEYPNLRSFLPEYDLAVVNQRLAMIHPNKTEKLISDDVKVPKQIERKSKDKLTRLKELKSMLEEGLIDESEFNKLKTEIIE